MRNALSQLAEAYDAVNLDECAAIGDDAHNLALVAEILLRSSRDWQDFTPSGTVRRHFLALCAAITRQLGKQPQHGA